MEINDEILEKLKKAGKIAGQAISYSKTLIKPDASVLDVCNKVEQKIKDLGGELAFPTQISLNDVAAHFCPASDDKTVFTNQTAKIDLGVHIDGWIGDTALTIDLSGENGDLVKASKEALNNALKLVKPGIKLREVGKEIHETITSHGFSPVRNLSGHGLDEYQIHTKPSVPNYDNGDETELKEGQVIAIEPFATNGAGVVYESSNATIFSLANKRPVRMPIVRKVLNEIEKFNELPFTSRWLENKFSHAQVRLALNQLLKMEIIKEYPPLIDKNHGLVSQAEHSLVVKDKPIILTTREE